MQRASRLKRELQLLATEPPPGITCWQNGNHINDLQAQILGCTNTPYEKGVFALEVIVPERYPFEPPKMRFLTPIYHPNIDSAGRICLDVLRLPPKGAWRPSLNIATLLTSIQILMNEPNPDDPLMADISSEYKYNKQAFLKNARQWTEKYASQTTMSLEITNEENHKSQAELPKDSSISQKRKGSNISGLSKKCRLET
ncbi:ubiquitin-conjugating enzyme E2 T [Ahaetulla prasina]|uniref:ubiquitin-conjugating enzyme E2 T n=1 Tax=Ahaetulla prasina TaxID=499056 RepID=UPI0026475FB2|nr:ubiquitin-conjugating enzyme E2 T [Ahaetulla prasina]